MARVRKPSFGHLVGKSFGALLHEYRNKANLSVQKLSQESEIDRKYIYELEKGLSQPTLATLFRLANALDADCTEMVARTRLLVARGSPRGRARRQRGRDGLPVPKLDTTNEKKSDSGEYGDSRCEEK